MKNQDGVPCLDVYISTVWKFVPRTGSATIKNSNIKFIYKDKYYNEIEYLPDFGPEDFISNFGGFVGIFLGYSLMQLPELLSMSTKLLSPYFKAKKFR